MSLDHEPTVVLAAVPSEGQSKRLLLLGIGLGGLLIGLVIGMVLIGLVKSSMTSAADAPAPAPTPAPTLEHASDGSGFTLPDGQSARETGRMVGEELRRAGINLREFTIGFGETTGVGEALDELAESLRD